MIVAPSDGETSLCREQDCPAYCTSNIGLGKDSVSAWFLIKSASQRGDGTWRRSWTKGPGNHHINGRPIQDITKSTSSENPFLLCIPLILPHHIRLDRHFTPLLGEFLDVGKQNLQPQLTIFL